MDLQLNGRRVFVTGSSSGIGEAIARMMAGEGARVAIGELANDGQAADVHAQAVTALAGNAEILISNVGGNSEGNTSKTPDSISADDFLSNYRANILTQGIIMVDGLPRFGRQKFGDPDMSFDEVNARFAAEKVFDMPPVGRLGMPWTGLVGCTVVPQVCDSPSGVVTHMDLGAVKPAGLVRRVA